MCGDIFGPICGVQERLEDKFLSHHFEGLFPRDNPRNTRFAINFFTSIGLGGLTEGISRRFNHRFFQQPPAYYFCQQLCHIQSLAHQVLEIR